MKKKKVFLTLSIVFAVLTVLCLLFGIWCCVTVMDAGGGLASVLIKGIFSMSTFALMCMMCVFGVLGTVFSALALKKQILRAPYVTALAVIFFIFAVFGWINISNSYKYLSSFFIDLQFAFLGVVFTVWVIACEVLGGVFSILALKKQEAKTMHITTLSVVSVLATVTACWCGFLYFT